MIEEIFMIISIFLILSLIVILYLKLMSKKTREDFGFWINDQYYFKEINNESKVRKNE